MAAQTNDQNEYISNYRSLYSIISLASQRLQLKLIFSELYEGIELINLPALNNALKNSYPSTKELFKKFPLRHLMFIDPQSKATMKSLSNLLSEHNLSVVYRDNVWTLNTCSTQESLTASSIKLMALFQRFIETTKKQILMNSLDERLKSQITSNRDVADKVSQLTKKFSKIFHSQIPASEKLDKILTALEAIEDKPEVVNIVLQLVNEWIPDKGIPTTHEQLCLELDSSSEILSSINQIFEHLRLIPYNEQKQHKDLQSVSRLMLILNTFADNKLVIPKDFEKNLCKFTNTLREAFGPETSEYFKQKVPKVKEIVADVKRCYTIELSPEVVIRKIPNTYTVVPLVGELIDKVAVNREDVSFEYFVSLLGDLPETRLRMYKNLEKHNILWSDEYFKNFYNEFAALLDLSK